MEGMRRALRWTWAAVACLALVGAAPDAGTDPRLTEAQRVTGEAKKLMEAGKYAEAIPKVEQALSLREVVAGAETVVVSLWKVDDDTTRKMMEQYYRNLLAGQGRVRALEEAMRSLRATLPHPDFWAPFIGIGRDTPLAKRSE
jgi:hypothetical protein